MAGIRDQSHYHRLQVTPYRLGMDSGPAVNGTDAATLRKEAAARKLTETTARCAAALAAAEGNVQRAEVALATAEERLRHAQDVRDRFAERWQQIRVGAGRA